jgi:hypothetical protein
MASRLGEAAELAPALPGTVGVEAPSVCYDDGDSSLFSVRATWRDGYRAGRLFDERCPGERGSKGRAEGMRRGEVPMVS